MLTVDEMNRLPIDPWSDPRYKHVTFTNLERQPAIPLLYQNEMLKELGMAVEKKDRHGENVAIHYARETEVEEIAPGKPPASEWREDVKGQLVSVM